ncbi:YkgJ family cysteine cluster protein [Desulfolucanica intricata]|uniref:YkgJ family cysteine cluster protein n=1 Tax=Desulfolucanica intricata TaxID=1285191 RepID=UPI00082957CB|nr:YkgJ family cysteine cluster protein [Desulfolucanica intricata]
MQLTQIEIYDGINFADKNLIFNQLNEAYKEIPDLKCNLCGQCCLDSPRITLLEYLNIYKYIRDELKPYWQVIIEKSIQNYFLNLVKTPLKCPFLDDNNKCIIYQVRPFNCRTFGHKTKEETEANSQAFAKNILEQIKSYWQKFEIIIPDEVINAKPYYCDQVKPLKGDILGVKNITLLMNKITAVERKMFSIEIIMSNENYVPFYNHLVNTIIGVRASKKLPDIMKEYLDHGTSKIMDEFLSKAVKYEF